MSCNCGIPSKANAHYFVVIGRPGKTSYTDIYVCTDHDPGTEDFGDVRTLFEFDNSDKWEILEVVRTILR